MTRDYKNKRGGGGGRKGGGGGAWKGSYRNKEDLNSDDPVINMFGQISKVLDARHDKRERIVKLSRDITIESKRIIFCLHRIKTDEDRKPVLDEAGIRLKQMKQQLWKSVAFELQKEDHYQFVRAYSAGLQEWVEALSFYHYLVHDKLITFTEVGDELVFDIGASDNRISKDDADIEETSVTEEVKMNQTRVTVPQSEYILGLADLTGELMRNAINSLGSGNMGVCFTLLDILQSMADGFGKLPRHEAPRDIGQKVYTLRQSCKKVEDACYAISVRGSEIPKSHLADIFTQKKDDGYVLEDGFGGDERDVLLG